MNQLILFTISAFIVIFFITIGNIIIFMINIEKTSEAREKKNTDNNVSHISVYDNKCDPYLQNAINTKNTDEVIKQLNYLTSNGITMDVAVKVVDQINKCDRNTIRTAEQQKELNRIMNEILQYTINYSAVK